MISPARFVCALAGLAATLIADWWHEPGPVLGYTSMDYYGDN